MVTLQFTGGNDPHIPHSASDVSSAKVDAVRHCLRAALIRNAIGLSILPTLLCAQRTLEMNARAISSCAVHGEADRRQLAELARSHQGVANVVARIEERARKSRRGPIRAIISHFCSELFILAEDTAETATFGSNDTWAALILAEIDAHRRATHPTPKVVPSTPS